MGESGAVVVRLDSWAAGAFDELAARPKLDNVLMACVICLKQGSQLLTILDWALVY